MRASCFWSVSRRSNAEQATVSSGAKAATRIASLRARPGAMLVRSSGVIFVCDIMRSLLRTLGSVRYQRV